MRRLKTAFRAIVLVASFAMLAPALDIDLHLVGYSFLPVTAARRTSDGIVVQLRDGSLRTIDLSYGQLVGTDGEIDRPRILHVHWLRITTAGRRANLVTTSAPLIFLAAVCLVLDLWLLGRRLRARRDRRGSDRDGPSPTPAARGSAGIAPPRP